MDEAKLQDIEARADHMTADDCTALTALVAEVRRLTAALDAARREGAEAMRVALVAMVGRRAAAWDDDADEHGDEDAATRWEEATEIRNAIRALPLPGDALPEHAPTPAPVCPAPTEGT